MIVELVWLVLIFSTLSQDPFPVMPKNPIFRDFFTADPSGRVWDDGRLYVYPSHDIAPPRGCDLMDKYHVFSTDNILDWVDHGQIIEASQVPWGRSEGGFMWAPDCMFKNGLYYFYFPHPSGTDWGSTWKIGIAISKEPAANFVVQDTYIPNIDSLIDPNVFIDDDGTVYFYHGGGNVYKGGILKENMIETVNGTQTMQGLQDYHEGTWVFKRDGIYYLTYPDNHEPGNQMRYATSNNPLGPWNYKGVFFGPCDSGTSHGSVVVYKSQWFLFYHNKALSGINELRSVCVTKLNFTNDGAIVYQEPDPSPTPEPEPRPEKNPQYVINADGGCEPYGPATFEEIPGSSLRALAQLHLEGAGAVFNNVDGHGGGNFLLYLLYSALDGGFIDVTVNGVEYDTIFAHGNGSWTTYNAYAHTQVTLESGRNTIDISGGHGGLNVESIILIPA